MKHICIKENCKIIAVWYYMPGKDEIYYCDNHVPRGCSCNVDPDSYQENTDALGRLFPCCEYDYDLDGFNV